MRRDNHHIRHGFGAVRASVYGYPDVDEAYARALEKAASPLAELEDKHYSERSAGVRDRHGNVWWISQYTGPDAD